MALDEAQRAALWGDFMRDESQAHQNMGVDKANLRAAVDAADDWMEAAQVSYNNALPLDARTNLTTRQKAKLLAMVLARRYGVS